MNDRKHIALTEAQIIASEKGELQLEYRNGEKVHQVVWLKPPYTQTYMPVMSLNAHGYILSHSLNGKCSNYSSYDLFISEPAAIKSDTPAEQKPLYEVGEIIEVLEDYVWFDAEYIGEKNNYIVVWNGGIDSFGSGRCRKKQTKKTVTLDGKAMTVIEAIEHLNKL